MPIIFYHLNKPYGSFTNYSHHGFELEGQYWPTVEHYYQAQKVLGSDLYEQVRLAESPAQAKRIAHSDKNLKRNDWPEVKVEIMRRAVMKKFETHKDLMEELLGTGEEELVEGSKTDLFWGCGSDGTGQNRLGKILMEIRAGYWDITDNVPVYGPKTRD
ncbi:MAG TPA: NADAR family protein [Methanospirillum sp.]|nr:NADAR family protein [Methanospirillum sp.]